VRAFDQAMSSGLVPSLLLLFVAGLLVTVIHEGGHLLAAVATGQGEIATRLGSHGTIIDRRLGEIRLRVGILGAPWRPAGSVTFDAARTTARAMAVIAAAGPAASILGAVLTGYLVSHAGTGIAAELLAVATVFGLLVGLGNLIPFTVHEGTRRAPGPRLQSDGLHLRDALRVIAELRGA
jgi:hypothetical protein